MLLWFESAVEWDQGIQGNAILPAASLLSIDLTSVCWLHVHSSVPCTNRKANYVIAVVALTMPIIVV